MLGALSSSSKRHKALILASHQASSSNLKLAHRFSALSHNNQLRCLVVNHRRNLLVRHPVSDSKSPSSVVSRRPQPLGKHRQLLQQLSVGRLPHCLGKLNNSPKDSWVKQLSSPLFLEGSRQEAWGEICSVVASNRPKRSALVPRDNKQVSLVAPQH
jgi:hypothetical protein